MTWPDIPVAILLLSLFALFGSSLFGAIQVARMLGFDLARERTSTVIACGTLGIAWCLASALILAFPAEIFDLPLVQIPTIAVVSFCGAIVLGIKSWFSSRNVRPVAPPGPNDQLRTKLSRINYVVVFLPVALLHGFLIIDALLRPPGGYDGLAYHLPMIVRWLQSGRLYMVEAIWQYCMPGNCELWQMLFASLGFEPLINVSLVPVGLLLAVIVFGVSTEIGAKPAGAVIATLFVLSCPFVALQIYSTYVDMFGATFVLGAMYWVLRLCRSELHQESKTVCVLLAGLSTGIAIGTKLQFIAWAGLIALGLFGLLFVKDTGTLALRGPSLWRRGATWGLVFGLAMFVCSGFWFFRNTYHTGWFLYPFQVQLAGWNIGVGFPLHEFNEAHFSRAGWMMRLVGLLYPWFEWKNSGYNYSTDNGLGVSFATFAVIGTVYWVFREFRSDQATERSRAWLVLLFVVIGIFMYLSSFRTVARYALPLWLIMFALSGFLVGWFLHAVPRTSAALVCATLSLTAVMITLWPAKNLLGRVREGDMSRACAYQIPQLFDQLPRGTVVLNLGGRTANYSLVGASFGNRVIESMVVDEQDLQLPLSPSYLNQYEVNIVYTRGNGPPPFVGDVAYEKIFDDTEDPGRLATTVPSQVYRVVQVPPER